jgi:hypothetical protein
VGPVNSSVIVVRVVAHISTHVLHSAHGPRAGLNDELVCPARECPDPASTTPGVPGPGCRPWTQTRHRQGQGETCNTRASTQLRARTISVTVTTRAPNSSTAPAVVFSRVLLCRPPGSSRTRGTGRCCSTAGETDYLPPCTRSMPHYYGVSRQQPVAAQRSQHGAAVRMMPSDPGRSRAIGRTCPAQQGHSALGHGHHREHRQYY